MGRGTRVCVHRHPPPGERTVPPSCPPVGVWTRVHRHDGGGYSSFPGGARVLLSCDRRFWLSPQVTRGRNPGNLLPRTGNNRGTAGSDSPSHTVIIHVLGVAPATRRFWRVGFPDLLWRFTRQDLILLSIKSQQIQGNQAPAIVYSSLKKCMPALKAEDNRLSPKS